MQGLPHLPEFFQMPIETFKLYKKGCFGKIRIQNAHRISRIHGCDQPVSCFFNRAQVAGRHVASYSNQGKILHFWKLRRLREVEKVEATAAT